jgi:hypothetical protein
MVAGLKLANLGLAFALELCMLAALAYWGIRTGHGLGMRIALGVGAPLLAAVLWGLFMAPQATWAAPEPWHLVLTLVFFAAAITGLVSAGQPSLGAVFAAAVVLNQILIAVWRQ